MIDQSMVTTGYDTEVLVSERYLSYALLTQIEGGLLNLVFPIQDADLGLDATVTLHPPLDYVRRYEPDPAAPLPEARIDSFEVELLIEEDDPADTISFRVRMNLNLSDNLSGRSADGVAELRCRALLKRGEPDDDGFVKDLQLGIELVDLGGFLTALLAGVGVDVQAVLAQAKARIDRDIPLGFVQHGQRVQEVLIRKLPGLGEFQPAVGIYVNLVLHSGPEDDAFVAGRGDVSRAQNFLRDGQDLAFATSPGLFALLGTDLKERLAEPASDGSGDFRYPWRKDPSNKESEEVGRIKEIRVGPEITPGTSLPTGRLLIDFLAEYTDAPDVLGNPDVHLQVLLRPRIEDGLVKHDGWDVELDVDLGLLATLIVLTASAAIGFLFGVFFSPTLAILVAAAGPVVAQKILSSKVAELDEDAVDANFLDALPLRVPFVTRRWDPLYATEHEVAALVEGIQINTQGIAFEGRAALFKEPAARQDAVIRDEERNADGVLTHLRYRVADFARIERDLAAVAPGTDRREFRRADPVNEPRLVSLTRAQILSRIAEERLRGKIPYIAKRVVIREGQIDQLLVISVTERTEESGRLIRRFRRENFARIAGEQGTMIREDATAALTESLGRPPSDEELDKEVDRRINALIDELQPDFEKDELPGLLDEAIAGILRFDLPPAEMAGLELNGVLFVSGKAILRARDPDPDQLYYRDPPDGDPSDNLLSLPRYDFPYQPPV